MTPEEAITLLGQFAADLPGDLARLIGEQSILLKLDLIGPNPNTFTPRLTGNLASTARIDHDGLNMRFVNDAVPYLLKPGSAAVIAAGEQPQIANWYPSAPSYASEVHEGLYEAEALAAFEQRMVVDLASETERFVAAALNV